MSIDVIIISDAGPSSFSASNPLKLAIGKRDADIQAALSLVANDGRIVSPVAGDGVMSWAAAPKLNGIALSSHLAAHHISSEIIDNFTDARARFRKLLTLSPRAVVISTTFITHKDTLRSLADEIRAEAPDIFLIAGGPFVYTSFLLMQRAAQKGYDTRSAQRQFLFLETGGEPDIDLYVISPRGVDILAEVVTRLKGDLPIGGVPNIARRSGAGYNFGTRVDDLVDAVDPAIDWAAMPDSVFSAGVVPLQASTGCTSQCAFCNFTKDPRLNRIKPLDQLVAEMKAVARRGIRYVWFADDNFRLGRKDLAAVCRRFIEEGLGLGWMTFIRAGVIADVDVALLKAAGCVEVQMGLESADPQVLRNMNKRADPVLYGRVLRKLLAAGINCSCYFIFGFPGETADSAARTRQFIKALDAEFFEGSLSWSLFPFFLAPMSPIYTPEARAAYGLNGYMETWEHQTMDSKTAMKELMATFMAVKNSGPIYRGDNLVLLDRLGAKIRKRFFAVRHALAKQARGGELDLETVTSAFREVLPESMIRS